MESLTNKNREHYKDPTAKQALRNIRIREEQERLEKIGELVQEFRQRANTEGFEIIGRIPFRHVETGKEYK